MESKELKSRPSGNKIRIYVCGVFTGVALCGSLTFVPSWGSSRLPLQSAPTGYKQTPLEFTWSQERVRPTSVLFGTRSRNRSTLSQRESYGFFDEPDTLWNVRKDAHIRQQAIQYNLTQQNFCNTRNWKCIPQEPNPREVLCGIVRWVSSFGACPRRDFISYIIEERI